MRFSDVEKSKIAFIVGSGRSGTTLLTRILNSNSKLISSIENDFVSTYFNHFRNRKSYTEKDIDKIVEYLWIYKSINQNIWKIDEDHLRTFLTQNISSLTFKSVFKTLLYHFNGNISDKAFTYCIDKNPFYLYRLKEFGKYFDDAKFIFIVRDYRGKFASRKKLGNKVSMAYGISWNRQQKMLLNFQKKHPESCTLIRYEDLVSAPEKVIKQICDFLNIPMESTMLEHEKTENVPFENFSADISQKEHLKLWHSNINNKINTDSISKWKTELTLKETKVLEHFCGKTGELFGYETTTSPSILTRFFVELRYRPLFIFIFFTPRIKKAAHKMPLSWQRQLVRMLKR